MALLGILLGSIDVLAYRLSLENGIIRLRTLFGAVLQRRCDETIEWVFTANENITIRFLDWRSASPLRKAKELSLKQFDSSRFVFNIPRQAVDLKAAGELLLRSAPPEVRMTHLR